MSAHADVVVRLEDQVSPVAPDLQATLTAVKPGNCLPTDAPRGRRALQRLPGVRLCRLTWAPPPHA